MSNQRMAGNGILPKAEEINRKLRAHQQQIKSVMDRQTRRDVAATQGQVIPFSSADIISLGGL